jgi:diguanylate cyclase (GGDEF)-like protein
MAIASVQADVTADLQLSKLAVDLPTLCVVAVFITAIAGLLLLFSSLQNRREPSLALWGLGYLLGAVAPAFLALRGLIPLSWSMIGAGTSISCAYAVVWAATRMFEGRLPRPALVVAGGAIWLAACQFEAFRASEHARILLLTPIIAAYTLASAYEVFNARDRELASRWPMIVLLLAHAGFIVARIPLLPQVVFPLPAGGPHQGPLLVLVLEAIFFVFCLAFLRVNMSKERAELEQRKAALTDWLTGVANRRAFFDHGEAVLKDSAGARHGAALVLFDIDRFKEVNDTAGHQAGDAVLKSFAELVTASLRPGELFGRLGGEEFACLLPKTSLAQALQLAERIRSAFAALPFPYLDGNVTVSIGLAMSGETTNEMAGKPAASGTDGELQALLAAADRALYRAKAEGRNRVARTALVLVDSADAARRPAHGVA